MIILLHLFFLKCTSNKYYEIQTSHKKRLLRDIFLEFHKKTRKFYKRRFIILQKKIIILLASLVVAFVFCGAASAASVQTNHVTTAKSTVGATLTDQDDPAISGKTIVWEQQDIAGNTRIYTKNIGVAGVKQVQTSLRNQWDPDVYSSSAGTYVVWVEQNGLSGLPVVWVKNLAYATANVVQTQAPGQLAHTQSDPKIYGTRVVWSMYNEATTYDNIFVKNFKTANMGWVLPSDIIFGTDTDQSNPDIAGNVVVWTQADAVSVDNIRYKNLVGGANNYVPNNSGRDQDNAAIDGNWIVWDEGSTILNHRIMVTNIDPTFPSYSTAAQVNVSILPGWNPAISGTRVVWTSVTPATLTTSIWVSNLANGMKGPLTSSWSLQGSGVISGVNVAFVTLDTLFDTVYWRNIGTHTGGPVET
jgi:hypothetical protein